MPNGGWLALVLLGGIVPGCATPPVHGAGTESARTATRDDEGHAGDAGAVELPELVLVHQPGLGFATSVWVYHDADRYKIVATRASEDACPRKWIQPIAEADVAELTGLLAVLDPHTWPAEDPCDHSVRDGSTWTTMRGLPNERVQRSRLMTTDARCAEVEHACARLMELAGLACSGRGCFSERERERGIQPCP